MHKVITMPNGKDVWCHILLCLWHPSFWSMGTNIYVRVSQQTSTLI